VKIRNPNSTRPWQHVLEPLSGYLRVAQVIAEGNSSINGEPFNFGPNADQNHTVIELLQKISGHWNFRKDYDHFLIESSNAFHEAGLLKLNCDKALLHLQWRPVLNFLETAQFTGSWYNAYYNGKSPDMFALTFEQIGAYEEKAGQKNIPWTE
jgi:CDP-glucose 4,6-dehydratase